MPIRVIFLKHRCHHFTLFFINTSVFILTVYRKKQKQKQKTKHHYLASEAITNLARNHVNKSNFIIRNHTIKLKGKEGLYQVEMERDAPPTFPGLSPSLLQCSVFETYPVFPCSCVFFFFEYHF